MRAASLIQLFPFAFTILTTSIQFIQSVEIPNGIIGAPEVECGEEAITVIFNTRDRFQGQVFAVGHSEKDSCRTAERNRRTTSIEIQKDDCGVVQLRSDNPPGLFVNVKVMINFHPNGFITKVDRGFEISCFYMQADKTVTFPLTVSMQPLNPRTELAEMPRCRYEVFEADTNRPATVVAVGDPLLHKWTCESSTPGLWCMTVHSCYVQDGTGTEVKILQEDGCANDKFLLDNLEYATDLMASKEAHAFKFADRVVVNFQCSVRLDVKDGQCQKPECRRLRKRSIGEENETTSFETTITAAVEIDVRSPQIDVIDTLADFGERNSAGRDAVWAQGKKLGTRSSMDSCGIRQELLLASSVLSFVLLLTTLISSLLLWRSQSILQKA